MLVIRVCMPVNRVCMPYIRVCTLVRRCFMLVPRVLCLVTRELLPVRRGWVLIPCVGLLVPRVRMLIPCTDLLVPAPGRLIPHRRGLCGTGFNHEQARIHPPTPRRFGGQARMDTNQNSPRFTWRIRCCGGLPRKHSGLKKGCCSAGRQRADSISIVRQCRICHESGVDGIHACCGISMRYNLRPWERAATGRFRIHCGGWASEARGCGRASTTFGGRLLQWYSIV